MEAVSVCVCLIHKSPNRIAECPDSYLTLCVILELFIIRLTAATRAVNERRGEDFRKCFDDFSSFERRFVDDRGEDRGPNTKGPEDQRTKT